MRMSRALCAALILLLGVISAPASAFSYDVRDHLCFAVTDNEVKPADLTNLKYDCDSDPQNYQKRWLWLRVDDPAALSAVSGDWHLLVDQSRFERIVVVVDTVDGRVRSNKGTTGDLGDNWAPGGHLRFDFSTASPPVTDVFIGFYRLDHLPIMRKVRLISHDALELQDRNWLLLMGIFAGAVASSLLYNLALYSGLGARLRQFYGGWALSVLLYGLFWSNLAFYRFPNLAGEWGVRINMWLVSSSIALGLAFFVAYLEPESLPRTLRRVIHGIAIATLAVGLLASFDQLGFAGPTDNLFTIVALAGILAIGVGLSIALQRGSRAARYYALAWFLPITVILFRLARNLGLMAQTDFIDYATFGAMAVQAVLLSIGIGDRFRMMQVEGDRAALERDRASLERDSAAAEREDLRRLAETDTLTGLYNRRGFVQRAQAMLGRHGALAIIDLDHFKEINDSFGHDVGDAVLARVAATLAKVAGEGGMAARLGGEEFALIAPLEAGETARVAVENLDVSDLLGPNRRITLSAGVATGAVHYEELFVAADRALYRAKQDGRNCVVVAGTVAPVRPIRYPAA